MSDSNALPPLKQQPKLLRSSAEAFSVATNDFTNASRVKKEVMRLYPRLQSIEREINSIRSTIPANLTKTLMSMRNDITLLMAKSGAPDPHNTEELNEKLAEIESRLEESMKFKIDETSQLLEAKIGEHLAKSGQNIFNGLFDASDVSEKEFESRLSSLEALISSQQRRTQSKLTSFQQILDKFNSKSSTDTILTEIQTISELNSSNKAMIADIQTQMTNLKAISVEQPASLSQSPPPVSKTSNTPAQSVPDLTIPMTELNTKVMQFQKNISESLQRLEERAAESEQKAKTLNTLALDMSSLTQNLEIRVSEVELLCNNLVKQVEELGLRVSDDKNQRAIQSLSIQIDAAHSGLKREITALGNRIKACISSEPLIQ